MKGELVARKQFLLIYGEFEKLCQQVGLEWKNDGIILGEDDTFSANITTNRVDVFFFYKKEDKDEVEEIAKKLKQERIKLWIDAWELPPGKGWKSAEPFIAQANSVAVFISRDGWGPWKDKEQLFLLNKFYKKMKLDKRELPLIPVLLKDAKSDSLNQESIPSYLKGKGLVDFNQGDYTRSIDNLVWGITESQDFIKERFLATFSNSNITEKTGNSIIVSLPAYNMENLSIDKREINTLKQKATYNLSRLDTKTVNFNDASAFLFIMSLFQKNLLPMPQKLMGDEEKIDFNDKKKETYILIGLSNNLVDLNDKSIPGKYFYIDTIEEKNKYLFFINLGRFNDSSKLLASDRWDTYGKTKDDKYDFGLFAKFEFGSKKIIVCGGTTETATSKLASYVYEKWENIYYELKTRKERKLDPNDSFAVVIKIPKNGQARDEFVIAPPCIKRSV